MHDTIKYTFHQQLHISHTVIHVVFAISSKGCDPGGEMLKLHKKVIM